MTALLVIVLGLDLRRLGDADRERCGRRAGLDADRRAEQAH